MDEGNPPDLPNLDDMDLELSNSETLEISAAGEDFFLQSSPASPVSSPASAPSSSAAAERQASNVDVPASAVIARLIADLEKVKVPDTPATDSLRGVDISQLFGLPKIQPAMVPLPVPKPPQTAEAAVQTIKAPNKQSSLVLDVPDKPKQSIKSRLGPRHVPKPLPVSTGSHSIKKPAPKPLMTIHWSDVTPMVTDARICARCGRRGHVLQKCPKTLSRSKIYSAFGSPRCFLCHEIGHKVKDCPYYGQDPKDDPDPAVDRVLRNPRGRVM